MSRNVNKLQSEELIQVFKNNDIVLLTESWLGDEAIVNVNGYQHFQLNRTLNKQGAKRNSGGIIAYIRNELVTDKTLFLQDCDDILWLKLDGHLFNLSDDVFLSLIYNVPEGSSRQGLMDNMNLFDRLSDHMIQIKNLTDNRCQFLVCGDFNARTSDYADYVQEDDTAAHIPVLPDDYATDLPLKRVSEDRGFNRYGSELLDFCKQTGLRILNGRVGADSDIGKCTYVGSAGHSLVDYVIASQQIFSLVENFNVSDPNILSDHCIVNFSLCSESDVNNNNSENVEPTLKYKYVWKNEHVAAYQNALESDSVRSNLQKLKGELLNDNVDMNENLSSFQNIVESVCAPFLKKNIGKKNNDFLNSESNQPWYNEDCKLKRNHFYNCLSNYRSNKHDVNCRENMVQARSEYKKVLRKSRYAHRKLETQKLEKARYENAKDYWKLLKNLCSSNAPKTLTSQHFAEYFKAINNPDSTFFQADDDVLLYNERYVKGELEVMFQELNVEISLNEIRKGVQSLKCGKSSGPDLLLNEFLKYGINSLIEYMHILFNKIFDTGIFPDAWGEGYIVPLHKKGSIENVENYRGITLLSVIGKLFTNILNSRLNDWAENYQVYVEAQAGFRKCMGTLDNIFVMHSLISHCLNNNKKLYSAFIDFRKAFDFVVRDVLWYKLIQNGVRGKILNVIQSMYRNIKSRIKFNNNLSSDFSSHIGVRQGECLSPFLFSMYINDLESELMQNGVDGIDIGMLKLYLLLYADDIVIFSNTSDGLQKGLDVLSDYCQRWKLTVASHRLEIEVGRWARPNRVPIDERKCRFCNTLEDEFHFLLECNLYRDLRMQFIKRYFWNRPNVVKLRELMTSMNKRVICNLSLFIEKAFKIRYGQ